MRELYNIKDVEHSHNNVFLSTMNVFGILQLLKTLNVNNVML